MVSPLFESTCLEFQTADPSDPFALLRVITALQDRFDSEVQTRSIDHNESLRTLALSWAGGSADDFASLLAEIQAKFTNLKGTAAKMEQEKLVQYVLHSLLCDESLKTSAMFYQNKFTHNQYSLANLRAHILEQFPSEVTSTAHAMLTSNLDQTKSLAKRVESMEQQVRNLKGRGAHRGRGGGRGGGGRGGHGRGGGYGGGRGGGSPSQDHLKPDHPKDHSKRSSDVAAAKALNVESNLPQASSQFVDGNYVNDRAPDHAPDDSSSASQSDDFESSPPVSGSGGPVFHSSSSERSWPSWFVFSLITMFSFVVGLAVGHVSFKLHSTISVLFYFALIVTFVAVPVVYLDDVHDSVKAFLNRFAPGKVSDSTSRRCVRGFFFGFVCICAMLACSAARSVPMRHLDMSRSIVTSIRRCFPRVRVLFIRLACTTVVPVVEMYLSRSPLSALVTCFIFRHFLFLPLIRRPSEIAICIGNGKWASSL